MPKMEQVLSLLTLVILIFLIAGCDSQERAIEEQNKELVRYVVEQGVNKGDLAVFEKVLSPNYVRHCQAMPPPRQEIHGVETMTNFLKEFFDAVPDYHEKIELIMADGDKVAYITTGTGTQTGQMGPFPPSGKKFTVVSHITHRFVNGKNAETSISWDNVAMLTQLGHLALPEGN